MNRLYVNVYKLGQYSLALLFNEIFTNINYMCVNNAKSLLVLFKQRVIDCYTAWGATQLLST